MACQIFGVLGDGAVAGEFAGGGDVQDGLFRPGVGVGVERGQIAVGVEIRLQIGKVRIMVAAIEQRVAGLVLAERVSG